jgi:hypothetical protein
MRWIVFEKLENIRREQKTLGSIAGLIIDTMGIHLGVTGLTSTANAASRQVIKAAFFEHLACVFFDQPVNNTNGNRCKSSASARHRMEDFLVDVGGIDYDNSERVSFFLCRLLSEQVFRYNLH